MEFNYKSHLNKTCNHLASCLPNTKFVETKWGGYFQKGNRKIGITISPWQSKDSSKSLKINKWKNGYGINLNPIDVGYYTGIKESVKKGLGIKE